MGPDLPGSPLGLAHPGPANKVSSAALPRQGAGPVSKSAEAGNSEGQLSCQLEAVGLREEGIFTFPHHYVADMEAMPALLLSHLQDWLTRSPVYCGAQVRCRARSPECCSR